MSIPHCLFRHPVASGALVLILFTCSCSVIRVVEADSPTADCAGSGQHFCHTENITTSWWKPKNKENIRSQCVHGISRFKVTTKPGDLLLGVFTAGFVVRQRIDWDCAQRSGGSEIE